MYVFQSTLKFLTNWPGLKKENRKYWLTIIGFVFRHLETIFGLLGKSWAGLLWDNLVLDFLFSCSSPFDPTKYISIGGPPFSHLSYCSCDRVCHQQIQQVIKLPKSNNQRRKYDTLKIGNINTIGLSKTYGSVSVGREFWLCYVTF